MQRRWIIRGFFIAILVLCIAAWAFVRFRVQRGYYYFWVHHATLRHLSPHYPPAETSAIGINDGVVYLNYRCGPVNIPVLYVENNAWGFMEGAGLSGERIINPHGIYGHTWLARQQLRFGFDFRSVSSSGHTGFSLVLPLWLPILFGGITLFIVWRKTRELTADHAFAVLPIDDRHSDAKS